MTAWARVDCDFNSHEKTARLSCSDRLSFLEVILWCRRNDTDGYVPAEVPWRTFLQRDEPEDRNAPLPSKNTLTQAAVRMRKRLEKAGLVNAEGGGWQLHGYGRRQPPSTAEMRAKWREDAARQRRKVPSTDGPSSNTDATRVQHDVNTKATRPRLEPVAPPRGATSLSMQDLAGLLPSMEG